MKVTLLFAVVALTSWAVGTTAHNPVPANIPLMLAIGIPLALLLGGPVGLVLGLLVGLASCLTRGLARAPSAVYLALVGMLLCLVVVEVWFRVTPTFRSDTFPLAATPGFGVVIFATRFLESRRR